MGRRNVYVNAEREALFDEAAAMAGNLSAAIDAGVEMYVRQVRAGWLRTKLVERTVGRGRDRVRYQFRASFVDEVECGERTPAAVPGRLAGAEIHQGLSGRFAVWRWSDPDWSVRAPSLTKDPLFPSSSLPDDWFERWGIELRVFDTVDEVAEHLALDEDDSETLRRRAQPCAVEYLEL